MRLRMSHLSLSQSQEEPGCYAIISVKFRDRIHFDGIAYHSEFSKGEGYPGKIRVSTPAWLGFTDQDIFTCNYTSKNISTWLTDPQLANSSWHAHLNLTHAPRTSYFDIDFPQGFTYADIIEFSFSMTVDPDRVRVPGSGQAEGEVIFSPVMPRNQIMGFPATNDKDNLQAMGNPLHLTVKMVTADCEDELVWTAQGVDQACPEAPTVNKFQVCRHVVCEVMCMEAVAANDHHSRR